MSVFDKKDIIFDYGEDTGDVELHEFRASVEIKAKGKTIRMSIHDSEALEDIIGKFFNATDKNKKKLNKNKKKLRDLDCC